MIKIIEKTLPESYSPKISCFWIIDGELYGNEVKLKDATASGDYLVTNELHYLMWNSIQKINKDFLNKDYEYFPRGRARFNIKIQQVEVIADKKIINNEKIKDKIREELGLLPTTIFITDDHYESKVDVYLK